ncbi:MAG: iron-containing alcohol dehydrogenase [Candidatus Aenigmarchaeota archaeon]|nr:iron-containing alcohol dehydrogenase [Candidatus Aenigmarchaeota archaeon]
MIEIPRLILIEKGAINKLPEVLQKLDIKGKALIIVDEITKDIAGNKIKESLEGSDFVMIKSSRMEDVETIKKAAEGFDCIIGVGGGKILDTSKMAAMETEKPFISFPTAPSHDGICSENVSLTVDGKYQSLKARVPFALVADIDIIKKAPYRMIASGAADLVAKYTANFDWKLAKDKQNEEYNDYAAELALASAKIVKDNANDIKNLTDNGIKNLVWGLVISGISMSMISSSRPGSGAEHMFSHALDALCSEKGIKGALHGEQCGFGSILMGHHQGENWGETKELLEKIGAPTTAKDLGIEEEILIEALLNAKNIRDRYTILDEKPLDREKAREILIKTGVI